MLRRFAPLVLIAAVVLIAPNAFWLVRSTVRIENRGSETVSFLVLEVCETRTRLESLEPGQHVFRVLPQCGEDTMIVSTRGFEPCRAYVEESMNHFRVWFSSLSEGGCESAAPPFSSLLLSELR